LSEDEQIPAWWIYQGTGKPGESPVEFPDPPPWRAFSGEPPDADNDLPLNEADPVGDAESSRRLGRYHRAKTYRADNQEIDLINLALYLRRPLLVTGLPGVGKSTLAYSVALELNLGPVLRWPITSRSTLTDGLYQYDAVGRLHAISVERGKSKHSGTDDATGPDSQAATGEGAGHEKSARAEIGSFITLGPLGTALLPRHRPRVLLIDEIDKSDVDLPNDLLNVFEEGEFVIPELARLEQSKIDVMTADRGGTATLEAGLVRCAQFPLVVLSSNEERDFPRAFLRRCIRLEISPPGEDKLARMVAAHLPSADSAITAARQKLIEEFLKKQKNGAILANDQLLNALLMVKSGLWDSDSGRKLIDEHLLRSLEAI
jgi:MoxR-like ATPase